MPLRSNAVIKSFYRETYFDRTRAPIGSSEQREKLLTDRSTAARALVAKRREPPGRFF